MASKPITSSKSVFESIIPIPNAQQKHTFFDAEDYIPIEVLKQINNRDAAKEIGFFFYEKKERIVGVTICSDTRLTKIYTISQDNIKRVWGQKLRNKKQSEKEGEKFFLYAEVKLRPRAETKPAPITSAPSSIVD